MHRILIIGSPGAGKSTLARELGGMLDLPVIHMDREYWQPGWVEPPKEEWHQRVAALVQGERWIMDGNYGGSLKMRLSRAERVIFMDYPRWLCLWRVVKRLRRHWGETRPDVAQGCNERGDWEFIKFVWHFNKRGRLRNYRMLGESGKMDRTVVLKSPKETREFMRRVREEEKIGKR
jgi:adenylate kinase family enzyme